MDVEEKKRVVFGGFSLILFLITQEFVDIELRFNKEVFLRFEQSSRRAHHKPERLYCFHCNVSQHTTLARHKYIVANQEMVQSIAMMDEDL